MREITHRYEDPLDRVWITCAERIGLRLARVPGAYATTDGRGTLTIAPPGELDRDDCLAQMIFHELCHSLVEGPASLGKTDWGLDNETGRDEVREHATLRVQALLLRPLGLAGILAPTTDFRAYYDALPPDPLAELPGGATPDPSLPLARIAAQHSERVPWAPHLGHALEATAALAAVVGAHGGTDDTSLWARVLPRAPIHPSTPLPLAAPGSLGASARCETCAWASRRGAQVRCRIASRPVDADDPACERFEPALDCGDCGACCREAYHTVLLTPRERFTKLHRDLVVVRDGKPELPRGTDGRCPVLVGDGATTTPYRCRQHDDRPKTCRDFTVGSQDCLEARRRVGRTR